MESSVVLCGMFIVLYTIFIEVFTILFQLTGVSREKARMQVFSLLTNCGFTTSESEIITVSKHRRRLACITMLCGYVFAVLIVSILVNLFLTMKQDEVKNWYETVLILGTFLILYTCITRIKKVRKMFNLFIERIASRLMYGKNSNVLILIDILKEKALVEVMLTSLPECLKQKKLLDSGLKDKHNIQILYITHNGTPVESIDGDTMIHEGDILMVFGDYRNIRSLFGQS